MQKSSEVLQQAIEGVKDSVLPLACVHSCPWVLPFLQAEGHCWEVSQRRVLACSPPSRDHSVARLGYPRGARLLQLVQKILKCGVCFIFLVFVGFFNWFEFFNWSEFKVFGFRSRKSKITICLKSFQLIKIWESQLPTLPCKLLVYKSSISLGSNAYFTVIAQNFIGVFGLLCIDQKAQMKQLFYIPNVTICAVFSRALQAKGIVRWFSQK